MEDNMDTRKLARSRLLLGLLFALLIGVTTANASSGKCSLATLQGNYGAWEQGTVIVDLGAPFPTAPFPVALTGIATFDGKGNFGGTATASFGGVPIVGETFAGTYIVNGDCTYSDTFTAPGFPTLHRAGTITGEGMDQQLQIIYTDAWLVAFGTLRKTVPWGCSLSTLSGTYEVFGQGTDTGVTIGGLTPPFPAAHVGIFTADGAGHMFGYDTWKVDVVAAPTTFTIKYTVNPNCTASFTITDSMGPVTMTIHEAGTITGLGQTQEVHNIITDEGWVFADTAKRQ
jgi:hypothetical protein